MYLENLGNQKIKYDGSHWYATVRYSDTTSHQEKERLSAIESALAVGIDHGLVYDVESAEKAVKDSLVWLWGEELYNDNILMVEKAIQEYFYPIDENQKSREVHPLRSFLKEVLQSIVAEHNPHCRTRLEKLMSDYLAEEQGLLLKDNPELQAEFKRVVSEFYVALKVRRERFKQRAILNNYNYFVTFTRDDEKLESFEEFEIKLKNTLKNLKQRYGWKYQGTFEWSENGRLHAHLLVSIPDGTLPGKLTWVDRFNEKKKRMTKNLESDYFRERIGINDFVAIDKKDLLNGHTIDYILKYITKSTDQIYYCRGLSDGVEVDVDELEVATVLYYKYCARVYFFDSDFSDEESNSYVNNPNVDYFKDRYMLKQGSFL